jgi:hypothetical protein
MLLQRNFKTELRTTFCEMNSTYQIFDGRELKRGNAMHCGIRIAESACDARIGNFTWKQTDNQQRNTFVFKNIYIAYNETYQSTLGIASRCLTEILISGLHNNVLLHYIIIYVNITIITTSYVFITTCFKV